MQNDSLNHLRQRRCAQLGQSGEIAALLEQLHISSSDGAGAQRGADVVERVPAVRVEVGEAVAHPRVDRARGVELAICTNKPERFIAPLLAHFGIPATGREEHHGALVDVALLARVYPHIKAVEKATLDAVSQHFSFHLATKVEGANGDELIRRSMELEELIAFLKEEQSLIKEQFVSGIGNVTWQGQTFGSTYTPGAKRTEWDKVKAAHLAEVDLTPYQKDVAGSLKFHRNES